MIGVALAIVASTATGIWAQRRWDDRASAAARRGLVIALYAVIPFIIFFNLARAEIDADLGAGVVLGWVALAGTGLVAWLLGRFVLGLPRPATGAMISSGFIANTGYLGLPLVVVLLGADDLGEAVVYDTLVSAPAFLIAGFAVGAAFGSRAGEGMRKRVVSFFTRNPPLLAAAAALVAPDALAPDPLVDASRVALVGILLLGFFAVGTVLEEEAEEGELRVPPPLTSPVAAVVMTRLIVAPGLLYLLSLPLIDLPAPYLLLAAMPCGINTMIVAHAYGLDIRITVEALTWTTIIAVLAALGSLVL